MVGFGLKIPAIETRKTPITHVVGVSVPLHVTQVLAEDATLKKAEDSSSSSSESDGMKNAMRPLRWVMRFIITILW